MGRKLEYTPNSRIRQALRVLWLRSRERSAALKQTNNTCCYCGIKATQAKGREVKLTVHHLDGVAWDNLIQDIRTKLLQTPDRLAPCCKECHDKIHAAEKAGDSGLG